MRKTTSYTHLFGTIHTTQIEIDSCDDLRENDILVFAKNRSEFDYDNPFYVREFADNKRGHIVGNAILVRVGKEHGNSVDPIQMNALIASKSIRVFTASPTCRYLFIVGTNETDAYMTFGDFSLSSPQENVVFKQAMKDADYVFKIIDSDTAPYLTIKSRNGLHPRVSHQIVMNLLLGGR